MRWGACGAGRVSTALGKCAVNLLHCEKENSRADSQAATPACAEQTALPGQTHLDPGAGEVRQLDGARGRGGGERGDYGGDAGKRLGLPQLDGFGGEEHGRARVSCRRRAAANR